MEVNSDLDVRRYAALVATRVLLVILALIIAARAAHEFRGTPNVWLVASLFASSAAALFVWPILVPSKERTWRTYSLGPAFFLSGMFLLPPAALVVGVVYAILLAGIVAGTRGYRLVTQLSLAVIAYGGFSLVFDLAPRPSDYLLQPAPRVALEVVIAAAASMTMLLLRSIVLRVEHGPASPNWGSFQVPAIVEALYCLVLSVSITVLARIHLALLGVVYLEIAIAWWFVYRYRAYLQDVNRLGEFQVTVAIAVQEAQRPWSLITGRRASDRVKPASSPASSVDRSTPASGSRSKRASGGR